MTTRLIIRVLFTALLAGISLQACPRLAMVWYHSYQPPARTLLAENEVETGFTYFGWNLVAKKGILVYSQARRITSLGYGLPAARRVRTADYWLLHEQVILQVFHDSGYYLPRSTRTVRVTVTFGKVVFTLPIWPLMIAAALPGTLCGLMWLRVALRARTRSKRRRRGACEACGYDLRASTARCPECGAKPGSGSSPPSPVSTPGEAGGIGLRC